MAEINPYRPPAPLGGVPDPSEPPCPKCGARSASKVSFNWWGGAVGPRLFNVVKCSQCRTEYNGKTGKKLTKVIIAYQGVVIVVLIVLWAVLKT
jgi:hypothetical protein